VSETPFRELAFREQENSLYSLYDVTSQEWSAGAVLRLLCAVSHLAGFVVNPLHW